MGFAELNPSNAITKPYKYNATTNTWMLDNPTLLAGGVAPYYRTFGR